MAMIESGRYYKVTPLEPGHVQVGMSDRPPIKLNLPRPKLPSLKQAGLVFMAGGALTIASDVFLLSKFQHQGDRTNAQTQATLQLAQAEIDRLKSAADAEAQANNKLDAALNTGIIVNLDCVSQPDVSGSIFSLMVPGQKIKVEADIVSVQRDSWDVTQEQNGNQVVSKHSGSLTITSEDKTRHYDLSQSFSVDPARIAVNVHYECNSQAPQ